MCTLSVKALQNIFQENSSSSGTVNCSILQCTVFSAYMCIGYLVQVDAAVCVYLCAKSTATRTCNFLLYSGSLAATQSVRIAIVVDPLPNRRSIISS